MARAKHTDRADARRRWRQTHVGEIEAAEPIEQDPSPPTKGRQNPKPIDRPGLTSAFRGAYHPPHLREDLEALPWLLRTRAFLAPAALVLVSTAAVSILPANFFTGLAFQTIVYPPAMAPVFITGFFARRASYVLGLLIALIDIVAFGVFVYAVAPTLSTVPVDAEVQRQAFTSAITIGPLSGILFAAAAAWYRRFLQLSNASAAQRSRQRQQSRSRSGKPARG